MKRAAEARTGAFVHDQTKVLARIPVGPVQRLQKRGAEFRAPTEIARFGYNEQRERVFDATPKFFHPPPRESFGKRSADVDLSGGFQDRFIERPSQPENLDSLLIALKHEAGSSSSLLTAGDRNEGRPRFCTWRGIMTKILVTPYSDSADSWSLRATLCDGTLFLMEEPLESRESDFFNTPRGKLMTYWGYRYEALTTIGINPHDAQVSLETVKVLMDNRVNKDVVNTNVQFCSVLKTRFGGMDLFMGAEVDCIKTTPETTADTISNAPQSLYAELKTNRSLDGDQRKRDQQEKTFYLQKMLKTYFQCFLAGIPNVVVGWRDDDGFLVGSDTFKTLEIPRTVRNVLNPDSSKNSANVACWDPNICINYAHEVLSTIWETIKKRNQNFQNIDNRQIVYHIRLRNSQGNASAQKRHRAGYFPEKGTVRESNFVEISDCIVGNKNLVFIS
ncbi:decapping endonuclease targeting mRNA [Entophlyctis sp. JEL0112]|nr:decapping endonuclease targeting mRNA [Entophlyctis sp. JEL0112]